MNWAVLIPIIAQYGIPVAEALFQKWSTGQNPTQADFEELKAMAAQTAQDRMQAQLVAAGVDLNSDLAKQLLGLSDTPPIPGPHVVESAPSAETPPATEPPPAGAPGV